jgi:4'-phosphopantetheinyl transferase
MHFQQSKMIDFKYLEQIPYLEKDRQGLDLWLVDFEPSEMLPLFSTVLVNEEKVAAARFLTPERTGLAIASRATLRLLLSLYLQMPPQEIEILRNEYQKPILNPSDQLNFNVSHSAGQILIGVSRYLPIGVDIESMRADTDWRNIAKHYSSPAEYEMLTKAEDPQNLFYQLWTAKEAFMKGYGTGFHFPLSQFSVEYTDSMHGKVISIGPLSPDHWQIRNFQLSDSYMGAVAAPEDLDAIHGYRLSTQSINKIAASWNLN